LKTEKENLTDKTNCDINNLQTLFELKNKELENTIVKLNLTYDQHFDQNNILNNKISILSEENNNIKKVIELKSKTIEALKLEICNLNEKLNAKNDQ